MKFKVLSLLTAVTMLMTVQSSIALVECEVKVFGFITGHYLAVSEKDCNCGYAMTSGPFQEKFNYCTSVELLGGKPLGKTGEKQQKPREELVRPGRVIS